MNVLIIDNGTKHLGKLKELLSGNDLTVKKLFGKYQNLNDYDLIVLSGGAQFSLTSAPEVFEEEISLVKTANIPIIGICQGCEIIAKVFDSQLDFTTRKAKGIKKVEVIKKDRIFEKAESFRVYEAHHFAITDLGINLEGMAKSKTGYEVIRHKTKPIYGLQFHPEMMVDKSYGDEVFKNILLKLQTPN